MAPAVGFGSLRLAAFSSLESGCRFYVSVFCRNLASGTVNMFSHLIYFIKTFHKFCTLICKHDARVMPTK
jgi:hypothetical protein